ncbi:MAG: DUF1674 domain-containing protein [Parvularculaceae bacterium]
MTTRDMNTSDQSPAPAPEAEGAAPGVALTPAARRALEEAAARRRAAKAAQEKELGGPSGLEPTRYGDWERKGRAVDF